MRQFLGVKAAMAHEFSGYVGTAKMFRDTYPAEDKAYHRYYSAQVMRRIRFMMMGVADDTPRPRTLPPVLNFRMAKGGTGKTTLAGNVASCLALRGFKVLMIDGDPQASLTGLFGVDWVHANLTHIGELMRRSHNGEPARIDSAIFPLYKGGMLDLIGADITLANADNWLMGTMNRENAFCRFMERELDFFSRYDAVVIDSAPSSGLLTTAFMMACKTVLAVVAPEAPSLKALDTLATNVAEINQLFPGRNMAIHVVANRYNQRKQPHNEALAALLARYGDQLNDTIVREFVGFMRQMDLYDDAKSGTVLEREAGTSGARDIIDLTKSLVSLFDIRLAGLHPTTGKEG